MTFKVVLNKVASYKVAATLESDKKVTLIYGLNGSGKSTLSNFLYGSNSLDFKDCSRHGFDEVNTLVYNSRFVRDNFFEIDKLSGVFTLSKVNKEIEEKIVTLSNSIKDIEVEREILANKGHGLAASITTLRLSSEEAIWPIKTKYSGGDRVLEYCLEGLKIKARLFDHVSVISLAEGENHRPIELIKKEVEALQGGGAKAHALIPYYADDTSNWENAEILKKIIIGKSDSPIAALISKLNNADWVNEGLSYADVLRVEGSEICPFCQAPSLSEKISKAIKDYFDESFNDAMDELKSAESSYRKFIEKQPDLTSHFDNPLFASKISELKALHGQVAVLWKSNVGMIQQKIKSPSTPVELDSTAELIDQLNVIIKSINSDISGHNERINNKRAALASLKLEFWNRCRSDYDAVILGYKTALVKLDLEKNKVAGEVANLDSKLQIAKKDLVESQSKTVNVDQAINSINFRLQGMGIDSFSIVKVDDNRYRLSRNGTSAEDFQTLSEGEKTVISFIYFIELCKGKRTPSDIASKKIAVIDDPISSLSHIYVFHIGQLIKEEFSNSDLFVHVIILTHSLYFFYELADMNKVRREATQKLLRLVKNSAGSSIVDMKYEEIQNDYQAYWNVVMDENHHPALVANCMRNIIEYFFNFVSKKDLNNVFQMPSLKDIEHQAFCRFMNRESHSLGQNLFDYKEFDYQKFKEAFRLVFQEAGFAEHYVAMSK